MPDQNGGEEDVLTIDPRRKRLYLQNLTVLLDYHENGQTMGRVFWPRVKHYLGIVVGIGMICWFYRLIHFDSIAWLSAGLGVGLIWGDVRLVRISVALWPLQKRFIDWSRVREWKDRISDAPRGSPP